ncbi:unnamed protein product [Amoebophrya sp. A120]|nr:unnamed protein product [Amoebophrya sp. A120]|eukprot:GSA120T00024524001.1
MATTNTSFDLLPGLGTMPGFVKERYEHRPVKHKLNLLRAKWDRVLAEKEPSVPPSLVHSKYKSAGLTDDNAGEFSPAKMRASLKMQDSRNKVILPGNLVLPVQKQDTAKFYFHGAASASATTRPTALSDGMLLSSFQHGGGQMNPHDDYYPPASGGTSFQSSTGMKKTTSVNKFENKFDYDKNVDLNRRASLPTYHRGGGSDGLMKIKNTRPAAHLPPKPLFGSSSSSSSSNLKRTSSPKNVVKTASGTTTSAPGMTASPLLFTIPNAASASPGSPVRTSRQMNYTNTRMNYNYGSTTVSDFSAKIHSEYQSLMKSLLPMRAALATGTPLEAVCTASPVLVRAAGGVVTSPKGEENQGAAVAPTTAAGLQQQLHQIQQQNGTLVSSSSSTSQYRASSSPPLLFNQNSGPATSKGTISGTEREVATGFGTAMTKSNFNLIPPSKAASSAGTDFAKSRLPYWERLVKSHSSGNVRVVSDGNEDNSHGLFETMLKTNREKASYKNVNKHNYHHLISHIQDEGIFRPPKLQGILDISGISPASVLAGGGGHAQPPPHLQQATPVDHSTTGRLSEKVRQKFGTDVDLLPSSAHQQEPSPSTAVVPILIRDSRGAATRSSKTAEQHARKTSVVRGTSSRRPSKPPPDLHGSRAGVAGVSSKAGSPADQILLATSGGGGFQVEQSSKRSSRRSPVEEEHFDINPAADKDDGAQQEEEELPPVHPPLPPTKRTSSASRRSGATRNQVNFSTSVSRRAELAKERILQEFLANKPKYISPMSQPRSSTLMREQHQNSVSQSKMSSTNSASLVENSSAKQTMETAMADLSAIEFAQPSCVVPASAAAGGVSSPIANQDKQNHVASAAARSRRRRMRISPLAKHYNNEVHLFDEEDENNAAAVNIAHDKQEKDRKIDSDHTGGTITWNSKLSEMTRSMLLEEEENLDRDASLPPNTRGAQRINHLNNKSTSSSSIHADLEPTLLAETLQQKRSRSGSSSNLINKNGQNNNNSSSNNSSFGGPPARNKLSLTNTSEHFSCNSNFENNYNSSSEEIFKVEEKNILGNSSSSTAHEQDSSSFALNPFPTGTSADGLGLCFQKYNGTSGSSSSSVGVHFNAAGNPVDFTNKTRGASTASSSSSSATATSKYLLDLPFTLKERRVEQAPAPVVGGSRRSSSTSQRVSLSGSATSNVMAYSKQQTVLPPAESIQLGTTSSSNRPTTTRPGVIIPGVNTSAAHVKTSTDYAQLSPDKKQRERKNSWSAVSSSSSSSATSATFVAPSGTTAAGGRVADRSPPKQRDFGGTIGAASAAGTNASASSQTRKPLYNEAPYKPPPRTTITGTALNCMVPSAAGQGQGQTPTTNPLPISRSLFAGSKHTIPLTTGKRIFITPPTGPGALSSSSNNISRNPPLNSGSSLLNNPSLLNTSSVAPSSNHAANHSANNYTRSTFIHLSRTDSEAAVPQGKIISASEREELQHLQQLIKERDVLVAELRKKVLEPEEIRKLSVLLEELRGLRESSANGRK